jgi:hypothetical protein
MVAFQRKTNTSVKSQSNSSFIINTSGLGFAQGQPENVIIVRGRAAVSRR